MKEHFLLDPNITFLNFGSFGACPKPVFENLQHWQRLLEANPVQYIAFNSAENHAVSRKALADYVNCDADDLVYVLNPSYAMNVVAKNLPLQAGDEVLSTNMEYGACDRIFKYYTKQKGATYRQQPITLPLTNKQQFLDDFFAGWNERTKVVFIGQITSSTALILPVKEIIDEAKHRGAVTIVDGAHVAGQIPLDLKALEADVYTGACHKWMLTPKGVSFLYVRKSLQKIMDPLVVSWGYESDKPSGSQFLDYHQMIGTRDFSASLTVPAAIAFMKEHHWEKVSAACKQLVLEWAPKFCTLMNTQALCPLTEEFVPQMFSIPIRTENPEALQRLLFQDYKIEIPVTRLQQRFFIRYSINAFNSADDLQRLYTAMQNIMQQQPQLLHPF
jgi:isopenicillin-N epimerase